VAREACQKLQKYLPHCLSANCITAHGVILQSASLSGYASNAAGFIASPTQLPAARNPMLRRYCCDATAADKLRPYRKPPMSRTRRNQHPCSAALGHFPRNGVRVDARDVRAELRALSRMGVGYAFGFRAQPVLDGLSRIATSASHPFTGAPHATRAGCAARHQPEVSLTWHLSSAAAER
jgi:hypothetical protein